MTDQDKTQAGGQAARIFTVPADASFMQSVAKGLLARAGNDPLALADMTVLVPDSDTGAQLRRAIIEETGGKPMLLPRITASGDVDDDELSLKIADSDVLSKYLMDIPPPVTRLERQLILAAEILKIPGMSSSVQKAIKLGGELGHFMDELQRNDIELKNLSALVPEQFRGQWSKTEEFLKIITVTWPEKLKQLGKADPEDHRSALIRLQAMHWQKNPSQKPVIAVGFTDAAPATAFLLQSVAAMPQGQVVLPGFDLGLDDASWDALTPTHPQYLQKKIITALDVAREDVALWPVTAGPVKHARATNLEKSTAARAELLREAMRPAGTADGWSHLAARSKAKGKKKTAETGAIDPLALSGMDLVTCGTPQEEASVIALKIRETLEVEGRTALFVTADRALARRVSARLKAWDIAADDGAGLSLANTPAGIFFLSTADMAAEEWSPVPLLEALKHPFSALGEDKDIFRARIAALEDVIRGPRPAPGAHGVKGALKAAFNRAAHRPDQVLTPEQKAAVSLPDMEGFVDRLEAAGKDFFGKMSDGKKYPFADFIAAHILFCEALAADAGAPGAQRLWRGEEGQKLAKFFVRLKDVAPAVPDLDGQDYADVLAGLMRESMAPGAAQSHPRLKILSPRQAQLIKADVVIAGALNQDTMPGRPAENPWLSQDMARALGLPPAEEAIGAAAHQFTQIAASPNVLLTRALRSGDAPTVTSPFLTRLLMVLKGAGLEGEISGKSKLLDIHAALNTPAEVTPCDMPAPTPPVAARPKELPVTAIEAFMRDPFTIYAKYILKLRPKARLDASPSVAEKGNYIHAALDAFVKKYPDAMPQNAYDELLKMGEETFKGRIDNPSVRAFWWPRFERIAKWFVKFETERRERSKNLGTEVRGRMSIDMGDGTLFTVTAIADRIDRSDDDKIEIIDYKTGAVPAQKAVALGFSPQMTLEALIAYTGGFKGIDAGAVESLQYWKLSGGRPAGEVIEVAGDVPQLVADARAGIEKLVKTFNDPKVPYLPTPRPEWAPRYQNYGHLSRADEWGAVKKVARQKKQAAQPRKNTKGGPK